jgi:hypothetical protein
MPAELLRVAIVGAGRFANIAVGAWERLADVRITAAAAWCARSSR